VLALAAVPAHATFPGQNGKIAFHSNRDGNWEIYAMNPDGSGQTRLTFNGADDLSPAWSADGTKIAFASSRDGNYEIYTMNADGTGVTRITNHAAADVGPAWSPDGTKIAFGSQRDGNSELYTMNSNGTGVTRITNHSSVDGQPAWSPDGTKIAFTTDRNGASFGLDIYVINTDGTNPERVTDAAHPELEPSWSPDGTEIAYQHEGPVRHAPASTCYPGSCNYHYFTESNSGDREIQPTFSPDNTKLAFTKQYTTSNWEIVSIGTIGTAVISSLTNTSTADQSPDWQAVPRNYPRPVSATPIKVALVPAYKQCNASRPNARHKGVLTTFSCNPPSAESSRLTVGTPDFNGVAASAVGFVTLKPFCNGGASGEGPPCSTTAGDQLDGSITISQTDVRCQAVSGGCPNGALSDYVGSLRFELLTRITDRNSTGATGAATLQDVPLGVTFTCTATPATTVGSTCSTTTSIDAVLGGTSGITEGKRTIWDLDDIRISDGGADGVASTTGDNTLFVSDGLFFP
jgi:TolB protein